MKIKLVHIFSVCLVIGILCYLKHYYNRVSIQEKKNKEFFMIIDQNDKILERTNMESYACGRYNRRDLHDITEMEIVR